MIDGLDELTAAFEGLPDAIRGLEYAPVFRKIQQDLEQSHREAFESASSPGGAAWPPLSPVTIKKKGHARILVDSGALIGALTGRSGHSVRDIFDGVFEPGFTFGSDLFYSALHNRGGARLPQREHVGAGEAEADQMAADVADHIVGSLSRGPLSQRG